MSGALVKLYLDIRAQVAAHDDWVEDIVYYDTRNLEHLPEQEFLSEVAWCVFNSGMREAVVKKKWPALMRAFRDFRAARICHEELVVRIEAHREFGHHGKINAVIRAAQFLVCEGWERTRADIAKGGPDYLEETFPFIGPVTKYHLAKNIGFDCVKPDRHLVRVTEAAGYDSPEVLCQAIKDETGDRLAVIDYVIWRYAASINTDYMDAFKGVRTGS